MNVLIICYLHYLETSITIPSEKELDAVLLEVQVFPIPTSSLHNTYKVYFENNYGEARSYKEKHSHEGCDIIASKQKRNLYPVVSMTDGKITKMGYLPMGGYRIGIQSQSGHYYYYAHLASYAEECTIGHDVKAGELLGFMGDTGYGEQEGTTGKMPVHLHVGIYKKMEDGSLTPINPYDYLKKVENKRLKAAY